MQRSVYAPRKLNRKLKSVNSVLRSYGRGFTLVETMVVVAVTAIGVSLAVPAYRSNIEKRHLVSAAEEIVSFMKTAQSEAIKHNRKVSVSWFSPGGHSANWCIGASLAPKNAPCDCTVTVPTEADFCSIDGVPFRLVQRDFVDMGFEFMHMRPLKSSFAFDPVRGIIDDIADPESVDGDWLFYMHSNLDRDGKRRYELQMSMNITGQMGICSASRRKSIIAGYPVC